MTDSLADLTTFRVGGPAARTVTACSEAEIVETVRAADAAGEPLLVLGGGSNVLIADAGFDGVVVRDMRQQITVESADACGGATFWVTAGMPWDDVVVRAVAEEWAGIEALSGIPGSTGATPVQNVGAYGQEVGDVVALVRTWDRAEQRIRTLARGELGLGYRTSVLKESLLQGQWYPTPRYVVLSVMFQLRLASVSEPIRYPELARSLGVAVGERVDAADVRSAVLALRAGKGMVLDVDDHDTWSAGSFFTNPVLPADAPLPEGAPRFDAGPGRVKTSAAWLIQYAGLGKGHALPGGGAAALSGKHVLALTNRGGATAADLVALAREVREAVRSATGITLVPEPVLVNLAL